jgi:hypothetical protein
VKHKNRIKKLQDRFGKKTALGPPRIIFFSLVAPTPLDECGVPLTFDRTEASMEDETLSACVDDVWAARIQRLSDETIEQFKGRLSRLPHKPAECFRIIYLFPDREPDGGIIVDTHALKSRTMSG